MIIPTPFEMGKYDVIYKAMHVVMCVYLGLNSTSFDVLYMTLLGICIAQLYILEEMLMHVYEEAREVRRQALYHPFISTIHSIYLWMFHYMQCYFAGYSYEYKHNRCLLPITVVQPEYQDQEITYVIDGKSKTTASRSTLQVCFHLLGIIRRVTEPSVNAKPLVSGALCDSESIHFKATNPEVDYI
ncbi:hypothetical protein Trydic_g4265 [Trypoxylus dichotomus]